MSGPDLSCPLCGGHVTPGERFCEGCGADLGESVPQAPEPPAAPPAEAATVAAGCRSCRGEVADDGYCTRCGTAAAKPRDHFTEQPAPWVAAVCDRGIRHHRNEDAVALAASPAPSARAVLVVCDGVSSSTDSDVASLAAARAARDVLAQAQPRGLGTPASSVAAAARALTTAADAANAAVIANTAPGGGNPASCTFVAAVVDGPVLVAGWVGDSRAYWLPDGGAPALLTTDDSFAAEQIAAGVDRAVAESGPHAHAITRWLGSDAPDHTPRTVSVDLDAAGWVLVCSDGLWNYCSAPEDLAVLLGATMGTVGAQPLPLAAALVDWANAQGGRDNITVALARIDPTTTATVDPSAAHREEVSRDGNVLR
ncbi:MAG TPA: protein phosphatase 2C domain-containing protein [Actinotalea sp.]|nr:protein phosphatase 2C domain-containing protein [Actinotalea sp.]